MLHRVHVADLPHCLSVRIVWLSRLAVDAQCRALLRRVASGDMTSDEIFTADSRWPGTTIDGEPGVVGGVLEVTADVDGGVTLSLAVGHPGAPPEEHAYVEFVLSAEQADGLAVALSRRPRGVH